MPHDTGARLPFSLRRFDAVRRRSTAARGPQPDASLWQIADKALAFGKQAGKGESPMATCVMCRHKVQPAENWIKAHLWGAFAIFH